MKTLYFICLFFYVVGVVLGTLSVWYDHKAFYYETRLSKALCTLSGFVLLGTVVFGFLYAMILSYNLWK